jgi:hypothetical protein
VGLAKQSTSITTEKTIAAIVIRPNIIPTGKRGGIGHHNKTSLVIKCLHEYTGGILRYFAVSVKVNLELKMIKERRKQVNVYGAKNASDSHVGTSQPL